MGWSCIRFEKELKKFDRYLRIRLSHDHQYYLIERKAMRGSACSLTPKYERGYDAWERDRQGYVYVCKVRRDLLNQQVIFNLMDNDIQAHGGSQKYADLMDEQDRLKDEKLEQDQSTHLQNKSEEVFLLFFPC